MIDAIFEIGVRAALWMLAYCGMAYLFELRVPRVRGLLGWALAYAVVSFTLRRLLF